MYRILLLLFLILPFNAMTQSRMPCNNDPPPVQTANEVIPLCEGLDPLNEYCLTLMDNNCTPTNGNFPGCNPAQYILNNPNWFGFIAGSDVVGLRLVITNCQNNQGVQFALYEATGDIGPDPECDPSTLPLDPVVSSGLPQCACVDGLQIYANIPTNIGSTYYLVFDGCNGDICDIFITVDAGGQAPTVEDPTDIIFPPSGFEPPVGGDLDTVCAGAVAYPVTSPELFGASSYIWTLPNGDIELTFDPFLEYDFPNSPGSTYEFCVQGRSDCDTSDLIYCEMVVLAPLDTVHFPPIFLCEGESTTWAGMTVGPYENLTADLTIDLVEMATDDNFYDCGYIATVEVFVQNENDESPNQIDEVICGEPPITILGNVINMAISDLLIAEAGGASNGCDTFYSLTVDFLYADLNFDPNDVTCVMGDINLCPSSTDYLPSIGSPGLSIIYEWIRVSDGMVVSNGMECLGLTLADFTQDIEIFELTITMTINGLPSTPCVYGPFSVELDLNDLLPDNGTIDGPLEVCVGQIATYLFTTTDTDSPNPTWSHTHNGVSVLNQDFTMYTLLFNNAGTGLVCITPTNLCGSAEETCLTVDVIDLPIAGDDDFSCDMDYQLAAGSPGGTWFVVDSPSAVAMATFSNTGDPNALVTVDQTGAWTFGWALNTDNCFDQVIITFVDSMLLDGAESYICDNTNTNYTIEFNIVGGIPPYSVASGNGAMTGNMFESDPIPSNQGFTVVIEDAAGCQQEFNFNIHECSCVTEAATMSDTLLESCGDSCHQALVLVDATLDANDTTEYILHDQPGASISSVLSRNSTGEFCFMSGVTSYDVTYYISLVVGDDLGGGEVDLTEGCTRVAPGQPVIWHEIPNSSAGTNLTTCLDSINLMAIPSAGIGTWSFVSGPGTAIFSSINSPNSRVRVSACGAYEFQWAENNSGCTDSVTIVVEFFCNPEVSSISAPCNGTQTAIDLTINLQNGTEPYTEDNGRGSINGSQFTILGLPLNTPDTFFFTDDNGCQLMVPVAIGDCACITESGSMGTAFVNDCQDATLSFVYNNTNLVLDANDSMRFIVHTNPDTVLGDVIASSSSPQFAFSDGPFVCDSVYYVSAVAGDWTGFDIDVLDPCLSVSPGQRLRFDCMVIVDAGQDFSTCDNDINLIGTSSTGFGNWTALSAGSSISRVDSVTGNAMMSAPRQYTFDFSASNGGCSDNDQVVVTLLNAPVINQIDILHECNATNDSFTVTFEFVGGMPPYFVTGPVTGTIVGTVFTSGYLPSGTAYTFEVFDINDCSRDATVNSHTCACITTAGAMTSGDTHLCEDESFDASGLYATGSEMTDGNDIRNYILSSSQSDPTSDILSANTSGVFNFDDLVLDLGVTYYVAVIVGDRTSPTTIDLSDPCLSVSGTATITWYNRIDQFDIDPSGLEITCQDPQVTLSILTSEDITGYDILWTTSNGIIEPGDETLPSARVNAAGTYILTISHPLAGCDEMRSVDIVQSADVPIVMIQTPEELTCSRLEVEISGAGSSTGMDITYDWNGPGIVGSNTNITVMVNMTGVYTLTVRDMSNGCEITDDIMVTEDVVAPVAVASVSEQIDCDSDRVTVSGLGSFEGPNAVYSWTPIGPGNILSGADQRDMIANEPGTYEITVLNLANGCSSTATVVVVQEGNIISGFETTLVNPGCAGENDGSIGISNVIGGIQPFTYSFDGGQNFSANGNLGQLAPGTYDLVVRDMNGCEFAQSVTLTQPVDFFVELGDDQMVALGDEVVIIGQTNLPDSLRGSVQWSPLFDTTNQNNLIQQFTPAAGSYSIVVAVTNSNGCLEQDIVNIFVRFEERIYVPTAIHPNSIATDNRFLNVYADPGSVASISDFSIYDRWGARVFQRSNIPVSLTLNSLYAWDGDIDGQEADPGVYSYVVQFQFVTGESKVINGEVTLIK